MSDVIDGLPMAGGFGVPVPSAVVVTSISNFTTQSENSLATRYGRLKPKHEDLVFEFTRDPALMHQYHLIYEREFRAMHSPNYQHVEDEHDKRSHFLIIRLGKLCVGGARLSIKSPRQPHPLPIEMDGFRLNEHFPYLGQKEMTYGQVGRICLLPEFRDGVTTRMIFWHIHRKALALGASELFGTATLPSVRSYRQGCRSIGLEKAVIHTDVPLPTYPMCDDIKFYLIRIPLDTQPLEKVSDIGVEKPVVKSDVDA